jgi:hypothetical protein
LIYGDEIKQQDKISLDMAIIQGLGFSRDESRRLMSEIYLSYMELVGDRLAKAGKSIADRASSFDSEITFTEDEIE